MTVGILISYALERSPTNVRRAAMLADAGVPIVWDSGAYSVQSGVADVDVHEHADWVIEQTESGGPVRFVGLDVIGDADATLVNYRAQTSRGARVEPTIHYGAPIEQVDRLLDVHVPDFVNLGGLVPHLTRATVEQVRACAAFVAAVRRRLPDTVKIHVLGCVHPSIARLVDFDAGDSTSWLSGRRARSLRLFDSNRGDWRKFRVATTSPDVERDSSTWVPEMRTEAWGIAHRGGAWLRSEYGLEPADLVYHPDFDQLLGASIESVDRFSRWVEQIHGTPTVIYLAGGITERPVIAMAAARATQPTTEDSP